MIRLLLLMFCLSLVAADPAPAPAPAPPSPPALRHEQATGVLDRMVRDSDGKEIGHIVDVVVAPTGEPRAIVVDVGGYMGVGARRVAVAWDAVHVPPPGGKSDAVAIDMTDEQVRTAPSYTDRTKPATIVGPARTATPAPALPAAAPAPAATSAPPPAVAPASPPAAPPPAAAAPASPPVAVPAPSSAAAPASPPPPAAAPASPPAPPSPAAGPVPPAATK